MKIVLPAAGTKGLNLLKIAPCSHYVTPKNIKLINFCQLSV